MRNWIRRRHNQSLNKGVSETHIPLPKMGQTMSSGAGGDAYSTLGMGMEPLGSESEDELYVADDENDDDEVETALLGGQNGDVESIPKMKVKLKTEMEEESFMSITLQIFFPFLLAGMGMVAAGLVLDLVQHWNVFLEISELFILVPALLGLKGNLEMTLASRLSTAANLGKMDTKEDSWSLIVGNLALIQCQAIVVGLFASLVAIFMGFFKPLFSSNFENVIEEISNNGTATSFNGTLFNLDHSLLLLSSSVVTASVASFVLGLVMVGVIVGSRRCHLNPDNVATPIAASLGDLTTLVLLSWTSSLIWSDLSTDKWLAPSIIFAYILLTPFFAYIAFRNHHTRPVLYSGWQPVLVAMFISSCGGVILDYAVGIFSGIAVFQPVMNGVGGNLVAVQASRMSTHLHTSGRPGEKSGENMSWLPWSVMCGSTHAVTARILMGMVIPGHLIFTYTISFLEAGHTSPTPIFLACYLLAALLQVSLLLYICHVMIGWMWSRGTDPDNSAIPYLTALGDLLGTGFLALAFLLLYMVGDFDNDVGD